MYQRFEKFVPYRDRPLCFSDIETTGRTPGYHELTEIAFLHETKGTLCLQIAPEHLDRAEPEALRVSGYNSSDWAGAPTFKAAAPQIVEYLEDATLVGHNFAGFDAPMIKGNFEIVGLNLGKLLRDIIDTQTLARIFLVPLGLNLLSMKACRKFSGRSYEGAHSAFEDAGFAKDLYWDIMNNLKWHGKKDGKRIQESMFETSQG